MESTTSTCRGILTLGNGQSILQPVFRQKQQLGAIDAKPPRPGGDLLRRFLTADIEHLVFLTDVRQVLQQQGGLPDSRVAAQENNGSRHQSTAQHPVQLDAARVDPFRGLRSRTSPRR